MTETRTYTSVAIALHWIIAILLVVMIFAGWRADDLREAMMQGEASLGEVATAFSWHKTGGVLVLILSLARLGWRLTHKTPPLPETMKGWEKFLARFTHAGFYVLMIGMPLMGWLAASTSGLPNYLFDNPAIVLPAIAPENEGAYEIVAFLHGRGAWAIIILLALHAGGAIKHHIVDKDDVLARMLPFLRRAPKV